MIIKHYDLDCMNNEMPEFESCPANQASYTDHRQPTAMIEWLEPVATDNSGDSPTVICDHQSGTRFAIGQVLVTCTAFDGYGNSKSCTFYIDVKDNEMPEFKSCPANQASYTDHGQPTAMIEWLEPVATDNSGGSPTVICDHQSGTKFAIGQVLVTCTASDGYGNSKNCTFNVDVKNCTSPLGLENRIISDTQITASSKGWYYDGSTTEYFFARNARLHHSSYWRPLLNDENPWIKVQLDGVHVITGLVSQGSGGYHNMNSWVISYLIQYQHASVNASEMEFIKDVTGNTAKVFNANTDSSIMVSIQFDQAITTDTIQVIPQECTRLNNDKHCSLRLEILGCSTVNN
ncbi:hyalin-like isoform X3 [Amphiura filiformis]|uniref:hyalin-like isoform X3 n=1 Tax=Amphiura filiformis TaxID=82378 RepID=UPI003B211C66